MKIFDLLSALSNQSYPKNYYEVIVVNDGSKDNTSEIIKKFDYVLIENNKNMGLAESRNIGIHAARGRLVAFTDDDCIPDVDWLSNIAKAFKSDQDIGGISGTVKIHEVNTLTHKYIEATNPLSPLPINLSKSTNIFYRLFLYLKRQFSHEFITLSRPVVISSVVGANMAFRKDILHKLQGFDKDFTFGSEEEDISYRFHLFIDTLSLKFFPDVVVSHKFDSSFYSLVKKSISYGIGNARLRQKFPERSVTVYPFPFLVLALFSLVIFHYSFLFISAISLFILYVSWIKNAIKKSDMTYLAFPVFQFSSELGHNIGWIKKTFLRNK